MSVSQSPSRAQADPADQLSRARSDCDSEVLWQRFSVPFEYPVCFTENLFDPANTLLLETLSRPEPHQCHRAVFFIDQGVANAFPTLIQDVARYAHIHRQHIELVADPVLVPGGECIKASPEYLQQLQSQLARYHIDRHSYVIAIGGGAMLDAVGLVAATAHRGIRLVRVPTTVLAQNDSGVGVKNGINLFGQKNYLGTFAPPYAVLNDYHFIHSLPDRDKIAGMAEAVKVALIRDRDFYLWLEKNSSALAAFDKAAMRYMIKRCAELHMQQIACGGDPFETGSARPLDFGHWAAHKLETLSGYSLRHGEAVAIGLALDTQYSVTSGLLSEGESIRVCRLLERLGFTLWHDKLDVVGSTGSLKLLEGLTEFREHLGGMLTITLLRELGCGVEVNEMDSQRVLDSIRWLKER